MTEEIRECNDLHSVAAHPVLLLAVKVAQVCSGEDTITINIRDAEPVAQGRLIRLVLLRGKGGQGEGGWDRQ